MKKQTQTKQSKQPYPIYKTNFINHNNNNPLDIKKNVQNYQYSLNNILEKNDYFHLYSGVNKLSNTKVTIKVIPILKNASPKQKSQQQRQIQICKLIKYKESQNYFKDKQKNSSERFYKIYDIFSTSNNIYIMLQHSDINLKTYLKSKKSLNQTQAIGIFIDILQQLKWLFQQGYIHCNINPRNINLKVFGEAKISSQQVRVKARLIDFTKCKKVSYQLTRNQKSYTEIANSSQQKKQKQDFQLHQWTPYMSPLTLLTKKYQQNNDIWSLSILLYECLHGYHYYPWKFYDYNDLLQKIYETNNTSNPLQFPNKKLTLQIKQFLTKCLDPKNGFQSIFQVYENKFIRKQMEKRGIRLSQTNFTQLNRISQNKFQSSDIRKTKISSDHTNKQISNFLTKTNNYQTKYITSLSSPLKSNFLSSNSNNQQISSPLYSKQLKFNFGQQQTTYHNFITQQNNTPQLIINQSNKISIKQHLNLQISYMRFLNIILVQDSNKISGHKGSKNQINRRFSKSNNNQNNPEYVIKKQFDHKLFRFVMIKQLLSQKWCLKQSINIYSNYQSNPFCIPNLKQIISLPQNKPLINQLKLTLQNYDKKYQHYQSEMIKLLNQLQKDLVVQKKIKAEWRPTDILSTKIEERKEILSIVGVRLSRQYCKFLWREVQILYQVVKQSNTLRQQTLHHHHSHKHLTNLHKTPTNNPGLSLQQQQYYTHLQHQISQKCLKLDFLMSYYILNCLLIDDFSSPQNFYKKSGLNVIVNNAPMIIKVQLLEEYVGLIKDKLTKLEII